MGTDIHGIWQRLDMATQAWCDIASTYDQHRHYQLFAVLAGVRNGTGFAGVKTGDAVTPIAEQRGLPDDFALAGDYSHPISDETCVMPEFRRKYLKSNPASIPVMDMGDHSHSWLAGEEMAAWFANAPTITQTGVLSRAEYDAWDKVSQPESYCGGISGFGVVMHPAANWTHINVEWQQRLASELDYFFAEAARLSAEHGRIRFVFGFDS